MDTCDSLQVSCASCNQITLEPYIECCECNDISLCTGCFASGREVRHHKNYHKYAVRRNDFPLFDNCNWSANEEYKLLNALSIHGYGNWEEISKAVQTRSKLESQEHYKKYYIESVQNDSLNVQPETLQSVFPRALVPYLHNSDPHREPPRVGFNANQHLAGYNAFRSDFDLSYDNNAESMFNIDCGSTFDDDECIPALKVALFNAFNSRLKERARRYTIIQKHGLILTHKLTAWLQKFDNTLGRAHAEKLLTFMQFMSGMQFDALMESLSLETEKLQRIAQLCEYRWNGIRTLHGAKIFKKLKNDHDEMVKEQRNYTSEMVKIFDNRFGDSKIDRYGKEMKGHHIKRSSLPLDISDFPGFPLLSSSERELCSSLRLIPRVYLEIKEQLIGEYNKLGCLRLIDARRIVKKDVNKTRKIYDHLIYEGFISKPL